MGSYANQPATWDIFFENFQRIFHRTADADLWKTKSFHRDIERGKIESDTEVYRGIVKTRRCTQEKEFSCYLLSRFSDGSRKISSRRLFVTAIYQRSIC